MDETKFNSSSLTAILFHCGLLGAIDFPLIDLIPARLTKTIW
jgi:hypothetical protein